MVHTVTFPPPFHSLLGYLDYESLPLMYQQVVLVKHKQDIMFQRNVSKAMKVSLIKSKWNYYLLPVQSN